MKATRLRVIVFAAALITIAWYAFKDTNVYQTAVYESGTVTLATPNSDSQGTISGTFVRRGRYTPIELTFLNGNNNSTVLEAQSRYEFWQQINWSKSHAWTLANSIIRDQPNIDYRYLVVERVRSNSPAAQAGLKPGDKILAVEGYDHVPRTAFTHLTQTQTWQHITVERDGVIAELLLPQPEDNVYGFRARAYTPPLTNQPPLDTGRLNGPSIGLMATLAYLDHLTPTDLTLGLHLAGTGSIDADGWVGPIGGTTWKVEAAAEAGADVFFVPPKNYVEAVTAAANHPELQVVEVTSVWSAIGWLCANDLDDPLCELVWNKNQMLSANDFNY